MNKQKGFAPIVITVLIMALILSALVYFAFNKGPIQKTASNTTLNSAAPSSPADETANWKIHANPEFGFEFKYPSEWEGFGSGESSGYFKTPSGNFINLGVATDTSRTLEEYLQNKDRTNETGYQGGPLYEIQSTKTGQTNGLNYIQRQEYDPQIDRAVLATYFKNNNIFINITLDPPPGNSIKTELDDYNKLISSFKFTEGTFGDRKQISAINIYENDQLSQDDRKMLAGLYWPELKPFKSGDLKREVYLVNCAVTNKGFNLIGIPNKVENKLNIIETTLKKFMEKHYGGFPDSKEIENYEKVLGHKYKNRDSGINGVVLKDNGQLQINFFDSVAAYGGGSSRVACMSQAVTFTAQQFPNVKSVIMCIDKYPTEENRNCAYDFQP